jgi:hypothetical protein
MPESDKAARYLAKQAPADLTSFGGLGHAEYSFVQPVVFWIFLCSCSLP